MRAILDAIFKYLSWALFLLIAVMFEISWNGSNSREVIRLAVVLLFGIIVIDIIFALIGVYRRGSKKFIIRKTARKTEKRVRAEMRRDEVKAGALFGKRKQRIEQISGDEYDAPMIVFPPDEDEAPKALEEGGEDLRARLRSMISAWLPSGGDDEE